MVVRHELLVEKTGRLTGYDRKLFFSSFFLGCCLEKRFHIVISESVQHSGCHQIAHAHLTKKKNTDHGSSAKSAG